MDLKTYEQVKFELAELIRSGQAHCFRTGTRFKQAIRRGTTLARTAHSFGGRPIHCRRCRAGSARESLPRDEFRFLPWIVFRQVSCRSRLS